MVTSDINLVSTICQSPEWGFRGGDWLVIITNSYSYSNLKIPGDYDIEDEGDVHGDG